MRGTVFAVAVSLLLVLAGVSRAGPVLLASYHFKTEGGAAPEDDPRVEFILQLPTTFPPTDFFGLGLGLDVFWEDGDEGSFDYSADNDQGFEPFEAFATNGIQELFIVWQLFPSGAGGGTGGPEPALFGVSPDLVGNDLESVRLVVHEISIEPWVPDPENYPEIEGYLYSAEVTYEFYGTPVPEPTGCVLCWLALLMSVRRRG